MKKIVTLLLFSFFSCTTTSAGISTSNIPIVNKKYQILNTVSGTKGWIALDFGIVGIPLSEPLLNQLMQELINQNEADALINIRYWNDKMIFGFITYHRVGITAEAVKFEDTFSPTKTDVKKKQ